MQLLGSNPPAPLQATLLIMHLFPFQTMAASKNIYSTLEVAPPEEALDTRPAENRHYQSR